ncbi:DUF3800 domain-containing protein [candidate division KSB1 bacterium]|nr:DUF3800 domain-containing protein [candidate division KSB1 bacterium]
MCESRGGKEDLRLKKSFHKIYEEGTEYITAKIMTSYLTSSQLKIKPKSNNIAGLQIADLVAYPSYQRILFQKKRVDKMGVFSEKVAAILEKHKYYRGAGAKLWGHGNKWLP